jgi:hypothetical protein
VLSAWNGSGITAVSIHALVPEGLGRASSWRGCARVERLNSGGGYVDVHRRTPIAEPHFDVEEVAGAGDVEAEGDGQVAGTYVDL